MTEGSMTYMRHQTTYSSSTSKYSFYDSTPLSTPAYCQRPHANGITMSSTGDPASSNSANSILQTVREQEAQFERLTKELEAERRSVADQLEQCQVSSQTGSIRSLNSPALDGGHSYPAYIEQGADTSRLDNGEGDGGGGSQLMDSCLRVLEERGIMQSSNGDARGKSVAFDTDRDESHRYNGYDSRDRSQQSSSQNSYRQPEGGGMSRSEANYSLHTAAADNYASYLSPDQQADKQQQHRQQDSYGEYGDYRQPYNSGGDYVDSSAAASYLNNYRDYEDQNGLDSTPLHPNNLDGGQQPGDDYMYQSGGGSQNDWDPQQTKADYNIQQGSYRENNSNNAAGHLYDRSSQDLVTASREHLYSNQNLMEQNQKTSSRAELRGSRNLYGESQDELRRSPDHPRGSTKDIQDSGAMHHENPGYCDDAELYPSQSTENNDRFSSYNGNRNYEDTVQGNLYEAENAPGADTFVSTASRVVHLPSERNARAKDCLIEESRADLALNRHIGERSVLAALLGDMDYYNVTSRRFRRYNYSYYVPLDGETSFPGPCRNRDGGSEINGMYNGGQPSYTNQSVASHPMLADPDLLYGSRQSLDSRPEADRKWRPPDLPEVIEYLGHPNDAIKANAAAYLQHLCYGNNEIKTKTRSLRGIPALVSLLRNDIPEVHRNALGALLNLSRGYENDDNKRAMKNCGGIEALATRLDRSRDNDVRELITGILWNMSSLGELKKSVIVSALNSLVKSVILPAAGLSNTGRNYDSGNTEISWSTEFRNATGVLRNVSSDGPFARKQLRECDGLMEALLKVTHAVIGLAEMDNKPVENVVCTLRNLSFRLMEVDYPDFYDRKATQLQQTPKTQPPLNLSLIGCFGRSKDPTKNIIEYPCRTPVGRRRGEQLWQLELVDMYLPLLSECSNTDTLEAAVGAIQNLTACEWQPSIQFREHMRKQRGLPTIVELLGLEEADNVVCGAAIALRNLAIDKSNRTLIGKYAIEQLVSKLPPAGSSLGVHSRASEETIRAVLATLHEVFKDKDADSCVHASTLVNGSEGLERLMSIAKSQMKYTSKTLRSVHQVLTALWRFTVLRDAYKSKGYKEADFLSKTMLPKHGGNMGTMSAASTLTRSRSEPASNSNTIARSNVAFRDDKSDEKAAMVNDPYLGTYPSNGTLPIQRPLYQQNDDPRSPQPNISYNYQTQTSYDSYRYRVDPADSYVQTPIDSAPYNYQPPATNDSYRQGSYHQQQSYEPEYPDTGYHNQPLNGSHNFSQSREGLILNSREDYEGNQQQSEPLYARVDKRKTNSLSNQGYPNPNYNHTSAAISMESLNNRGDYSFQQSTQHDASATGVDSWV